MILKLDTVGNVSHFLTLVVIFLFVLGLTYFTTKYLAGIQKGRLSDSNIRLMEGLRISNNKYLQIVRIGEKYYCLAVGKDNISVICEIPKEEIKLSDEGNVNPSFDDVFRKLKNKITPKGFTEITDKEDFEGLSAEKEDFEDTDAEE